jgi:hypothetical protein
MIPLPEATVSVNSVQSAAGYKVYPNPVTGTLNFTTTDNTTTKHVGLYNVTGSMVAELKEVKNGSFDMSDLATGVYILKVISVDGATSVFNITKQ